MSKSFIDLIKRQSKHDAKEQGIQLSLYREGLAKEYGFSDYHEMQTVAKRRPFERRLFDAALDATGSCDPTEIVYEQTIQSQLYLLLDEPLSGPVAETNANGFGIDSIDVNDYEYDEDSGVTTLDVSIVYAGEHDEDRVFHGSSFDVAAQLTVALTDGKWNSVGDSPLEVLSIASTEDSWFQ